MNHLHPYQQTQLKPMKPCHELGQFLFNIGKASIHAGDIASRLMKEPGWDLVINLTGNSQMSPTITGFNGAQKIARKFIQGSSTYVGYPELVIEWPDGKVPGVTRKEWIQLVSDLREFDGKVLVHCMGGHGRTGTLLSILAGLSKAVKGDPVKWVRENYCTKTVETQCQIEYLKKDMYIKTNEGPRYMPYVPALVPMTPLNNDTPIGPWWIREEQALTGRDNLSGLFRCCLCLVHKKKILMHSTFMDGTGYCFTCNADANLAMGEY